MASEFGCAIKLEALPHSVALTTMQADAADLLAREAGVEVARRSDGATLVLVADRWHAASLLKRYPGLVLDSAAMPARA
jgi:hypothetical protein